MIRLAGVAGLLSLACGCFEIEQTLVIDADGGGRYHQHVAVLENTSELLRSTLSPAKAKDLVSKMAPSWNGADRKALKAAGLDGAKVAALKGMIGADIDARFQRVSALDALTSAGASAPLWQLQPQADGSWVLTQRPGEAAGAPFDALDQSFKDKPDLPPDQALSMLGGLMEDAGKMKMVLSVEVPGAIVEAEPSTGLVIDGHRATWTFSMDTVLGEDWMSEAMGGLAGGLGGAGGPGGPTLGGIGEVPDPSEATGIGAFDDGFPDLGKMRVRFTPDKPLPVTAGEPAGG